MTEPRESKFSKAVGSEVANAEPEQEWVPRAIYTTEAKPDPKKITIPTLRLAQGMTAEVTERKAQIGQFVCTNFGPLDEVKLIPFAAQDIRVYKPIASEPPKCQAPTGEYGIGSPGGTCAECPLGNWGPKNPETGKSTPPQCKEGVSLRAYSLDHRCMVDFVFMGRVADKGAFIQQQAMAFGWTGFQVALTSTAVKNDKGQWYEPEVQMLPGLPDEETMAIVSKWYEIFLASIAS